MFQRAMLHMGIIRQYRNVCIPPFIHRYLGLSTSYPQKNVTDIFMIFYLWRKVERSGEWSISYKTGACQTTIKPLIPYQTLFVKHIYAQIST